MTPAELTGRADSHVVSLDEPGIRVHRAALAPFAAMREAAAAAGIDLAVASAFRDFARQRVIWNAKWRGERPVLDAAGAPVDVAALDPPARVAAILRWSALPGGSRHHWGTDLDVWDRAAVAPDYRLRLVPEEYAPGGPFAALGGWLDRNMRRYGFYRPYATAGGGVRPEPWHLSFAPVAEPARRALDVPILAAAIRGAGVLGEDAILAALPGIEARYLASVDRPPRMRSRWALAGRG
ncbi:MAG: M15 family metallopeptidase [Steroidobacteraceae bacterium]|jgi:LAS superfamily LD-carboxypeptidase LdcB|nr:M15 family metallopeptidase [Steroidobacteraceae bacterium]